MDITSVQNLFLFIHQVIIIGKKIVHLHKCQSVTSIMVIAQWIVKLRYNVLFLYSEKDLYLRTIYKSARNKFLLNRIKLHLFYISDTRQIYVLFSYTVLMKYVLLLLCIIRTKIFIRIRKFNKLKIKIHVSN